MLSILIAGNRCFILGISIETIFFISRCRTMLVKRGNHCPVAFPHRMNMPQGYAKDNRIIKHVGDIQIGIPLRDNKYVIALIIITVAIFDDDMVIGVYIYVKRVKTAVACHLYRTFAMKRAVVCVMLLLKIQMHLDIRFVDVRTLHILKELRIYDKVLLVMPILELGELNLKC